MRLSKSARTSLLANLIIGGAALCYFSLCCLVCVSEYQRLQARPILEKANDAHFFSQRFIHALDTELRGKPIEVRNGNILLYDLVKAGIITPKLQSTLLREYHGLNPIK